MTPTHSEPKYWVDIVIVPVIVVSQQVFGSIQDLVFMFFLYTYMLIFSFANTRMI